MVAKNAGVDVFLEVPRAKPVVHIRSPRLANPAQAAVLKKQVIKG